MAKSPIIIKVRRGAWGPKQDGQVVYRHTKGMTVEEMVTDIGFSEPVIRDAHKRLGLKPHRLSAEKRAAVCVENATRKPVGRPRNPENIPETGPYSQGGIVAQAQVVLRKRFDGSGPYWRLDGTPCDLDRLMTEANLVLAAKGIAQLGRNPKWLAQPCR